MSPALPRKVTCPICGKHVDKNQNGHYPFCSERCQMVDLGQWLQGGYRIESNEPLAQSDDGEDETP
ncbi:MAG: DNA gyrase inhibitor YacG [Nitrospinaceae bacterium]|nr:MAG: DNA gyrase inhibitor YacG [Nitrospinaceae bacterium]